MDTRALDLDQLRALVAVVDHGSFLSASEAGGVARATLRSRVDALERWLGFALLVRTAGGVAATEVGAVFAEEARRLLGSADALARFRPDESVDPEGDLSVVAPVGLPPSAVIAGLRSVLQRFPRLRLHIDWSGEPEPSAGADLALVFGPTPPKGAFRTFVLARTTERLVASPRCLADRRRPDSVRDLADHPLFVWTAPREDGRSRVTRTGERVMLVPRLATADIHLLRTLAEAGEGIALLPIPSWEDSTALEPLLPDVFGREVVLRVLVPEVHAGTARSRAAIAVLRSLADGGWGAAEERSE